jgi:hypothetical protein
MLTPRGSSPIGKPPQELVSVIFSYLVYDIHALLACSLTCYSWYTAAVPHLHHTLTIDEKESSETTKYRWPIPLRESYRVASVRQAIPLPRERLLSRGFTPAYLKKQNLRYFSALTNLQELGIDFIQLSAFMLKMKHYFGHLAPTLQFLALRKPHGSSRQIMYFIGLSQSPGPQAVLLCPSLVWSIDAYVFYEGGACEGHVRLLRLALFSLLCAGFLLEACAETLETLRLYSTDPYGEPFPRKEGEE